MKRELVFKEAIEGEYAMGMFSHYFIYEEDGEFWLDIISKENGSCLYTKGPYSDKESARINANISDLCPII